MGIAHHLREIGRGAAGARALDTEAAHDAMSQVLDGTVTDLERGAFVMALRMKGETLEEITGFLQAVQQRLTPIASDAPVVVLPSYNGARRLPNLTPLLAMWLAREGARVLVHGPLASPNRVSSAEVLHDLGVPAAGQLADVHGLWERREPAFVPTALLSPALERLLQLRAVLGVRNIGHTLAKMLNPVAGAPALRLVNHTHPEFGALMAGWARTSGADAMLLRGTEGEPVADPRRQPRMELVLAGREHGELSVPAHEGVVTELPLLPRQHDAATTAVYIPSVLSGEKPAPGPIARQVAALQAALAALQADTPARQMRDCRGVVSG